MRLEFKDCTYVCLPQLRLDTHYMSRSAPSRIDIVLVEVVNMNSELLRQFVGGCLEPL